MFSEAVDEVIAQSGRLSSVNRIVQFMNLTMRECTTQNNAMFHKDLQEDTIVSDAENYIWYYPIRMRHLRTAQYVDIYGRKSFPDFARPGKIQQNKCQFYYAALNYYNFVGIGIGGTINLAYYRYLPRLYYGKLPNETRQPLVNFPIRPAIFDEQNEVWSYWDGSDYVDHLSTPEAEETAQGLVSNWLLTDWHEAIVEGTLAKLLKMVKDESATTSFALYKQLQTAIYNSEAFETLGM